MLNITVVGTALSSYYLADPTQFLREHRPRTGIAGADADIRQAKSELRRLVADIDETSTLGQTRNRVLHWLTQFGWQFPTRPDTLEEPLLGHDAADQQAAWILVSPPGQHLDTSPTGRRAGKLRPQRQAEVVVRGGTLPAVLVTNGSELRVIRRDPGLGGESNYLAIDLPGLAELGDEHEWRVVWALLRPDAFIPDDAGANLWDLVERASAQAATAVTDSLSDGVRIAISQIANGALADMRRHGQVDPSPRLLLADALRVAYRLLFIAYAEDRGLLPVGTPIYDHGYSLRTLRRLITDENTVWEPDSGFLWQTLRATWGMLRDGIDAGELKIAGFNGGLFDPEQCPLLDDPVLEVGDTFVREAIYALAYTQPTRSVRGNATIGRQPINYRELGVEQLGSVYEGLLAYEPHIAEQPKVVVRVGRGQSAIEQVVNATQLPEGNVEILRELPHGTFYQFQATGERKGSGSYYTPRPLAHFVVVEALRPLVENASSEEILNLRVCDPAMGSGAFLVPAVHLLTEAYGEALIREGQDLDHRLDDAERAAYRRLIVERCIYGVDLNPMAVDLAKVSLWLATAASGKPLSFLDAHLRCGNALVGARLATFGGIPVPARDSRTSVETESSAPTLFDLPDPDLATVIKIRRELAQSPSEDRLQVRDKERRFARLLASDDYQMLQALGDWWVAPFYLNQFDRVPELWREGRRGIKEPGDSAIERVAKDRIGILQYIRNEVRPFHWEFEFPEVFFDSAGARRRDAGFDAVLGNPPWEAVTFKAAEFFGRFDPSYALIKRGGEKEERQALLLAREDVAAAAYEDDVKLSGLKNFIKNSGQFEMLYGHGTTFNLYRAFLERELGLLAPGGRIGVTIDSGVSSDAATAEHRKALFESHEIDWFVLCDNKNGIFPIHRSEQFLLLVAQRGGQTDPLHFTSGIDRLDHLLDLQSRTLQIPRAVIAALAPETLAVPDVRDAALLELLGSIYGNHPLLLDPVPSGQWQVVWGRELHLGDDRRYFSESGTGPRLYEGKHIHQFVFNFDLPSVRLVEPAADSNLLGRAKKRRKYKGDPHGLERRRGEKVFAEEVRRSGIEVPIDHYRLAFRQTARANDERTLIATVVPPGTALSDKLHWLYRSEWQPERNSYVTTLPASAMVYLCALLNSLILDFVARRKVSTAVTKSVMATLPIPDIPLDAPAGMAIIRAASRLICKSSDYEDLATVLNIEFGVVNPMAEIELRAELDARIAHVFGLTVEQFETILADFRQSDSAESSPVRPSNEYKDRVRHYFKLLGADGSTREP